MEKMIHAPALALSLALAWRRWLRLPRTDTPPLAQPEVGRSNRHEAHPPWRTSVSTDESAKVAARRVFAQVGCSGRLRERHGRRQRVVDAVSSAVRRQIAKGLA